MKNNNKPTAKKSDDALGLTILCALAAGMIAAHSTTIATFFITAFLAIIAIKTTK